MSFSERYGYKPARQALQLEAMDAALRNSVWNVITILILPDIKQSVSEMTVPVGRWAKVMWFEFFKLPLDQFDDWWPRSREVIRELFFAAPWHTVYDLIEFCSGLLGASERRHFVNSINDVLEREKAAYRLAGTTVSGITSEHELASIDAAASAKGKFAPVAAHIQKALEHLSRRPTGDYANAVKEAISGVEAACCIVTANPKATLGQALKQFEDAGIKLHQALKDAFSKLYGYTSDAEGIRHALLEESNLTYEDAQFMVITCSAFVNYLRALAKL